MSDLTTGSSGMWRYVRPLKNSRIRTELLEMLYEASPESVSLEKLVDVSCHSKADVIGALIGYGKRYQKEDSLTGLGLAINTVRMIDNRPVEVFVITPLGLEVKEYLSTGLRSSRFLRQVRRSNHREGM